MNPIISVAKAELLQHPEVIPLLEALSSKWAENGHQREYKPASGKLMPLIKLLHDHHLSYLVQYPSNSHSR